MEWLGAPVLESRGWHRAWLRYVSGLRRLLLGLAALLTRLLISGRRITARQTPSILTQMGLFFLAWPCSGQVLADGRHSLTFLFPLRHQMVKASRRMKPASLFPTCRVVTPRFYLCALVS